MVKEGSLPLTKVVNIFVDLCVAGDTTKDGRERRHRESNLLVQGIYSVSMYMIENAIPQKYIWYDGRNEVIQERIVEHEEELLWMFQELFKCRITKDAQELVQAYLAWEEGRPLESAMYLTVADHTDLESMGLVRDRLEVMDLRGEKFEV